VKVGGVDRLCSVTNTVDGTCYIKDKSLRFTYDLFYETDLNIEFSNTVVKCMTNEYIPCNIKIKLSASNTPKTFVIKNSTQFFGQQVVIDARSA
jgi:hypothetical protein